MPLPPLKTLPVFLCVCRHLNLSEAARELCLTHSAISQSIKQLEQFLQRPLFIRGPRQLQLTESGQRYRLEIERGLALVQQATERELCHDQQVSVNIVETLVMQWLIPRLPDLRQLHPDIDLRLSSQLLNWPGFSQSTLDLAIVYEPQKEVAGQARAGHNLAPPLNWPAAQATPLCRDELVVVCAPGKNGHGITQRLAQETRICVNHPMRANDWLQWAQARDCPLGPKQIQLHNSSQAIQAAIAGLGLFVTHRIFILAELENGLLELLEPEGVYTDWGYYLITQPDRRRTVPVLQCIDWLTQQARSLA